MKNEELALEEVQRRYPDKWVLLEETEWDEEGFPVKGRMIAYSSNRDSLVEKIRLIRREHPEVKTFCFYTGEKIPEELVVIL
ncbi:MAG TPA: hypothetical protein ENG33_04130 [Chloroflexi bacterium]|nr:hypothetical protein [Chloroflexota bacterium]